MIEGIQSNGVRWVKLQLNRWLQARGMDAYTHLLLERMLQQLPQRLQVRMRELQHWTFKDLVDSICAYESAWIAEEKLGSEALPKRSQPEEKTSVTPDDGIKPMDKLKPMDHDVTELKKWDPERGPKCFGCQQWGHVKAQCPHMDSNGFVGEMPESTQQSRWLVEGTVNGKPSKAPLLDSGSTKNCSAPAIAEGE